jgi:hypothetical protein
MSSHTFSNDSYDYQLGNHLQRPVQAFSRPSMEQHVSRTWMTLDTAAEGPYCKELLGARFGWMARGDWFRNHLFAILVAAYHCLRRTSFLAHRDVVVCLDPDVGPEMGPEMGHGVGLLLSV